MLREKAKANIRKLRALNIATSGTTVLVTIIAFILLLTDILTAAHVVLLYIIVGLFELFAARIIMAKAWKKYVYNVIDEDLDAPLFIEILSRVGRYDPFAIHQLQKLYAEGRHADVVSLCTKQLENPYAKRKTPIYLSNMALAYFFLGDDKGLGEVYAATEKFLNSLKDPSKGRKLMPMQAFYAAYLKRDMEACEAYFKNVPPSCRLAAIQRNLLRARLAQLCGDNGTAATLLGQVLAEAPNAPAAVTAKAHLEALERGEGYDKAFPEALPDPLFPVVTSEKRHKTVKIFLRVCTIVIAALLAYSLILYGITQRNDRALREEMRVAMEAEHDGVTVHDYFAIFEGETMLDTLAVCSTDKGVAVAALYSYGEDLDKLLCDTLVTFTEDELTGSMLPSRAFYGCTTDYYGLCAFYETEEAIPADAVVSIPVTVYGRELWFAVTYVRVT